MIVVNHNGARFIKGCLGALSTQVLRGGFEIVLVDNASTDGSVASVRSAFPAVRVISSPRNLGFAAGNNLGFRSARGEFLVLLNNDARPRPGWLEALVAAADADPGLGAVTSKLVFAGRPGVIQNAGLVLRSDGGGGDRGSGEVDAGQYDAAEEVFGFCGAAALLRRSALDDVGEFDGRFFMYYEDTDLSWRMRLRGWRILYQPAAVVEHEHAGSSREWSPFFVFHVDRNRLLMLVKCARPGLVLRSVQAVMRSVSSASRPAGGGMVAPPARGSRPTAHRRVLRSLLWHLPGMLASRAAIRGRRRVSDRDVELWLTPGAAQEGGSR